MSEANPRRCVLEWNSSQIRLMTGSSGTEISPRFDSHASASGRETIYRFGEFRLDAQNRLLLCGGKEIALPGRAFDVLVMLLQRPGGLLTKEEMLATVWGGSFVEEANLTVAISTLRRALNEDPHERRFVQTVARRGYRFIAEVHEIEVEDAPVREVQTATRAIAASQASDAVVEAPVDIAAANVQPIEAFSAGTKHAVEPGRVSGWLRLWPMKALAAVLLLALAAGFWYLMRPTQPIRTLAVLPLTESGAGLTTNEVLLLGLTDGLISRLEEELVVRPTSSVLRYSDADAGPVDPVAAGREQGVDAVLAWSLDDAGGSKTLKVRLVRVRDRLTLWQDSFAGPENGLSGMVDDAATAAARELHRLGAVPAPVAAKPPSRASDQAYQLYLRGRYFWNRRTVDGLSKSVEYFRQSIAADPNYAPAYAGLADSYALLASFSVEPGSSANADARSAALSAIQLDPTLAEPHASLGMIYFFTDWNLGAAEREFVRAIQLNPNYATAHHWYALDLAAMGRFPQALYEIHTAQRLDPLSLIIGTNVGWVEYLARDYAGAVRDLDKVLELDPNFARARTRLGMVEMATGNEAGAVANLTKALALSGDEDPWVEGLLGDAEARAGDRTAAEQALTELRRRSGTHYVPPISRGLVLIGLGRLGEAETMLVHAVEDHSTSMVYARVDPSLDAVRNEPGFQTLVARLKP